MKLTSENICATTGMVAIKNLNVWPTGSNDSLDPTMTLEASFREAMRRSSTLAGRLLMTPSPTEVRYPARMLYPEMKTLAEISTPRFETVGYNEYRLTGGLFIWANRFFLPGAQFSINGDELLTQTPDLVQPCVLTPVVFEKLRFDTYNGIKLGNISDAVLNELDLKVDKAKLSYAYPEDGDASWDDDGDCEAMAQIKYMSVYATSLPSPAPGTRVIAYLEPKESCIDEELGFDITAWAALNDDIFDQFFVEWLDVTKPFAFITIELLGDAVAKSDTAELETVDGFAMLFDSTSLNELKTHDFGQVVEVLKLISTANA